MSKNDPKNRDTKKARDLGGKTPNDKHRTQKGRAELRGAEDDATSGGNHSNGKGSGD